MKVLIYISFLCSFLITDFVLASAIEKGPGIYFSPDSKCKASLLVNEQGGFLDLYIDGMIATDITGIAWINNNSLVFTVSPIYGKPGLFLFDCAARQKKQILGPKKYDKAYPAGSDYFELKDYKESAQNTIIFFYYAPDVDAIDFKKFRTKEFLYQINLDATDLKKSSCVSPVGWVSGA
jgi:hypothetical protein